MYFLYCIYHIYLLYSNSRSHISPPIISLTYLSPYIIPYINPWQWQVNPPSIVSKLCGIHQVISYTSVIIVRI